MSVILEFTIAGEEFILGKVLSGPEIMHLELERIVPTGDMIMPYVWATGKDHAGFEKTVQEHPAVKEVLALDILGDSALYRVEWHGNPTDLIEGIAVADGVVLEARRDTQWHFRLRFPNHDKLTVFHNFILDQDIPIHIELTYTLSETIERGHRFNLSNEQREALVLATQQGYFATPRETSLEDLAAELGISEQAVSNRIRRGNEKILQQVLLSSASDFL